MEDQPLISTLALIRKRHGDGSEGNPFDETIQWH